MRNHRKVLPLGLLTLFAACGSFATEMPAKPAKIYHDHCSVCHGDHGDGQSRARGSMVPPPRDFTTPQAAVELTRERMIAVVSAGKPGTAMAGWATQLKPTEIAAVVDYVREHLMRPVATVDAGAARKLYAENCSVCHGDDGRGAKWTFTNMSPRPRDFTAPDSKTLSRDYMIRTVSYGKANTAMPGFETQLDGTQIGTVVDYVRGTFMGLDARNEPVRPILAAQPPMPGGLHGDAEMGKARYLQNCATCHGVAGDGKGPRAYFILPKPRDFRHPASRHGLDLGRLYQGIAKGVRGSEMPAWDTVLAPQEIADIAEYVYRAFIVADR
ncbi:MAG: c-type cytochrome [Chromatiales bacterium]|nr:c-type cytochrome [Chromatiales bacterium]